MINLNGTGVALITPMHPNGTVDFQGLENIVDHVADHVDYVVALGTTAEVATLATREKVEVIAAVKRKLAGRKPLILGHGGNDTIELLAEMKDIDWHGIDGVLSVTPYYNKPSQYGLMAHYEALANASPVPLILYNVPGRSGINLSVETTVHLAKHPNIVGTKEASGNIEQAMSIVSETPSDFYLISGDDMLSPALISIGAKGVISVLANAYPKAFTEMVAFCLKGDFQSAAVHWKKWLNLNPLLYEEGNPVGIKEVLSKMGVCGNGVRMPLVTASDGLKTRIYKAM